MKRIMTLSILFLSVFIAYGAVECDSVKVYFALNSSDYNPSYNNNDAGSMKKFIDGIIASVQAGTLDHITVYGHSSPEGPLLNNERLSLQRCDVIADYISRHTGIPRGEILTIPGYSAWESLRKLVSRTPQTPDREVILRILDKYIPAASKDRAVSDQCQKDLLALDHGEPYKWLADNLFPKLRYSLAVYSYMVGDSASVYANQADKTPAIGNLTLSPISISINKEAFEIVPLKNYNHTILPPLHRLAIKSNLLFDIALLPNLEVEWRFNDKWSVALEGGVAWWGKYSKNRSYRLALISPEVKRWIRPRGPWHGFYVGLFAGLGLYDFQKGSPGYRGEGVMGGVSAGYMWPLSRCLSMEAALGAGYMYTRYKEYKPINGHHVYQRTKGMNYFGPLKVKLSLVWRLWDLNRSGRQEAQKQTMVQHEK